MRKRQKCFRWILCAASILLLLAGCNGGGGGRSKPVNNAASILFIDTDAGEDRVSGVLTIQAPPDESGITSYVLYWGSSATQKLADTPAIGAFKAAGTDQTHIFAAGTPVPSGATHFLIYSANWAGESLTPVSLDFDDLVVRLHQNIRAAGGYGISNYIEFNGKLYFTAHTAANGLELHVYDVINPPSLVADIRPGPAGAFESWSHYIMAAYHGKLYFMANDGTTGSELWSYDGSNPPQLVEDINAGSEDSYPRWLTVFNDKLYFSAQTAAEGFELYAYDDAGPTLTLLSIDPGTGNSYPSYLTLFNGSLFFAATTAANGNELYEYDGVGAPILREINAGAAGGSLEFLTEYNGNLYFSAANTVNDHEICRYNPGTHSFGRVDLNPTDSSWPASLSVYNGKLYFYADNGTNGRELYVYDSTLPLPAMLGEINPSGSIVDQNDLNPMQVYGGKLYFYADNGTNGKELYCYDSTVPGVFILVDDIVPGAQGSVFADGNMAVFNGRLYFSADDGVHGYEMWSFNNVDDPMQVAEIGSSSDGSNPDYFCVVNDKLYFTARDSTGNFGLWVQEGSNPAVLDTGMPFSAFNSISGLFAYHNKLYFEAYTAAAGAELYEYDGVNPPVLFDVNPGGNGSYPLDPTIHNGVLYFSAVRNDTGRELFQYDGTTPPSLAGEIRVGPDYSYVGAFVVFDDELYFRGMSTATGTELFKYDGTTISPVADIIAGTGSSNPAELVVFNNRLYFSAINSTGNTEVWEYNGTNATQLTDLDSIGYSSPENLTAYDNRLYFSVTNSSFGMEIWAYDGTNPPAVISDPVTGSGDYYLNCFNVFDGRLYFFTNDFEYHALTSYTGAGSSAFIGQVRVNGMSWATGFTEYGNRLYFSWDDSINGYEPWVHFYK